jgi:hypothetical protein
VPAGYQQSHGRGFPALSLACHSSSISLSRVRQIPQDAARIHREFIAICLK